MAASIPTREPERVTAGDSIKWTRDFSDYPAGTWTLSYSFLPLAGGGTVITFDATADGTTHLVNVSPADSSAWLAGEYSGQAYVTDGTDRYQVWMGNIEILPNYQGSGSIDTRTKARKILDFIDASFEKLVQKQTVAATIEGVQLQFRSLKELQEARNYWSPVVANEEAAAGTGRKRAILAVFTPPS